VTVFDDALKKLSEDLFEVMYAHQALGVSAPQVCYAMLCYNMICFVYLQFIIYTSYSVVHLFFYYLQLFVFVIPAGCVEASYSHKSGC
jgi:hypothetical protein